MAHSYEYSVLRVIPDKRRGECVNIGIVVYLRNNLDVRVLPSFSKVTALDKGIRIDQLQSLPETLAQWSSSIPSGDQRYEALKNLGIVSVSDKGWFEVEKQNEYDDAVSDLMKRLVLPGTRTA